MVDDIPKRIKKQIARYAPVTTEGICLYPIRVDEYDEFVMARPAIEFLRQRLPVALMGIPILQAYYRMDTQSIQDDKYPTGLFSRTLLFLALALRLGEGMTPEERVRMIRPRPDPKDPMKLKSLVFSPDGEEICEITPARFQRLRPILAAQNGITLPDDDANPDLVDADEEIRRRNAPELDISIEALVDRIAALTGTEEAEIYGWPIARLMARRKSFQLVLDYLICGIGETQGTKWKKGNPSPSPFFERIRSESAAKVALSDFAGGEALSAVRSGMEGQMK